jgi:diaminopimelate epimerase
MAVSFTKMHGLGNDFVVIDDLGKPESQWQPVTPELARRMCDRRLGVGADQLLWLKSPQGSASARMDILNADGSVAEMCGNGVRAAALYLYRHGPERKTEYAIETLGGLKHAEITQGDVRVEMGVPVLGAGFPSLGEAIRVLGRELRFYEVDMGNPHAVIFVDRVEAFEVERFGRAIETHPRFPNRTNVEFIEVLSPHEIRVRVWERGAGITLACGTGACASAVASLATGRAHGELEVQLPGGSLKIRWDGARAPVYMTGPAEEVFTGQFIGA